MTIDDAPIRATWTVQPPAGPWCPPEWLEHLRAVAPTFVPPDSSAGHEDTLTKALSASAWHLVAAARRGRLHAHRAEHREDAAAAHAFPTGWCAAVADGAGSATHSRIGAALAVHAAVQAAAHAASEHAVDTWATARSLGEVLAEAAAAANDTLRAFAVRADIPLRDLRTTLLLAVLRGQEIGIAHVGDGGIALLHANGEASIPTAGHGGDFSGEVAHFLPDDGALEAMLVSVQLRPTHDVAGVLLATDGVEDPWYPMARTAPALFTQLVHGITDENAGHAGVTQSMRGAVLGEPQPEDAVARWLGFEKRGENDDRTLFVAVQPGVSWPSP